MHEVQYRHYRLLPDGLGATRLAAAQADAEAAWLRAKVLCPGTPVTYGGRLEGMTMALDECPPGNAWRKVPPSQSPFSTRSYWRANPSSSTGRTLAEAMRQIPVMHVSPWCVFNQERAMGIVVGGQLSGAVHFQHPELDRFGTDWFVRVPQPAFRDENPAGLIPLDAVEIPASEWYAAKEHDEDAAAAEEGATP